eukprot:CAMPEP_0172561812 /NCGR_PEP_ID=MMETSP1067-20121228/94424_1 /TAXON_ID=265564 ORGANISM="Thalassiosira punctigera, Strain Tpunct2005C2" /NCGR_SAMPLE_ID=MMETSP1067 /ASSEMBLY_ACC=CAM_ASM_000444 /LENGTH=45 /DNA_ID= /DNA_START= /DNA_END= /DNA_ORIENTATION=
MSELTRDKKQLSKINFFPTGPEVDIHAIPFNKNRQKRLVFELAAG